MAQESWDRDPNSHDAMAMAASKAEKPLPSSSLISDQSPNSNPNPNPNPTSSAIPNSNSIPNSGPIPNNFNPNPNPNPHNRSAVSPPSRPFHTQSVHLPTSGEMVLSRQMIQEGGPGSCGSATAGMPQESMSRCSVCKKRTGLLGFKCRCGGGVFCAHHRHSDKHACPFDYRLAARIAITKANPLILAPKLHKI